MKPWALAAIVISVVALAACDSGGGGTGGSGASGGSGPGGGGGTGGSGTGGSDASSSGGGGSGGKGGGSACDNNPDGCGDTLGGCYKCAKDGPCSPYFDACGMDNAAMNSCVALVSCIDECPPDDVACEDQCRTESPNGVALYDAVVQCIQCEQCRSDCQGDGAPICQ